MEIDDKELIRKTLNGDSKAYGTLFERHKGYMLVMLKSRSNDTELCSDIVQEAFIKAYQNLGSYNEQYSFGAWITRIAQNLLIDHNRKEQVRPRQSTEKVDIPSLSPTPEESLMGYESNKKLYSVLGELSEQYRKIIELRFWRDMSYEQIGIELSLPIGTVKTQIHRARKTFIELLKSK